ncbi:RNA helicase, putative [Plasmodium reichenowi]|uniref:RNA helicase, putative n=1 Tax=Plasmodium reichenowi TaxID=5854 RepID=A0A2P9D9H2_PLARE|nr:RNA helicase, putative [Plasmodium reichenowi]
MRNRLFYVTSLLKGEGENMFNLFRCTYHSIHKMSKDKNKNFVIGRKHYVKRNLKKKERDNEKFIKSELYKNSFLEYNLKTDIYLKLNELGIMNPSRIQMNVIPLLLSEKKKNYPSNNNNNNNINNIYSSSNNNNNNNSSSSHTFHRDGIISISRNNIYNEILKNRIEINNYLKKKNILIPGKNNMYNVEKYKNENNIEYNYNNNHNTHTAPNLMYPLNDDREKILSMNKNNEKCFNDVYLIVSPNNSGKTLSYFLPILDNFYKSNERIMKYLLNFYHFLNKYNYKKCKNKLYRKKERLRYAHRRKDENLFFNISYEKYKVNKRIIHMRTYKNYSINNSYMKNKRNNQLNSLRHKKNVFFPYAIILTNTREAACELFCLLKKFDINIELLSGGYLNKKKSIKKYHVEYFSDINRNYNDKQENIWIDTSYRGRYEYVRNIKEKTNDKIKPSGGNERINYNIDLLIGTPDKIFEKMENIKNKHLYNFKFLKYFIIEESESLCNVFNERKLQLLFNHIKKYTNMYYFRGLQKCNEEDMEYHNNRENSKYSNKLLDKSIEQSDEEGRKKIRKRVSGNRFTIKEIGVNDDMYEHEVNDHKMTDDKSNDNMYEHEMNDHKMTDDKSKDNMYEHEVNDHKMTDDKSKDNMYEHEMNNHKMTDDKSKDNMYDVVNKDDTYSINSKDRLEGDFNKIYGFHNTNNNYINTRQVVDDEIEKTQGELRPILEKGNNKENKINNEKKKDIYIDNINIKNIKNTLYSNIPISIFVSSTKTCAISEFLNNNIRSKYIQQIINISSHHIDKDMKHIFINSKNKEKVSLLLEILNSKEINKGKISNNYRNNLLYGNIYSGRNYAFVCRYVIFCNTRKSVMNIREILEELEYKVSYIHNEMNYKDRSRNYRDFKKGKTNILICTNILSRGVKFDNCEIINYDLSNNINDYIYKTKNICGFSNFDKNNNSLTSFFNKKTTNIVNDIIEGTVDKKQIIFQNLNKKVSKMLKLQSKYYDIVKKKKKYQKRGGRKALHIAPKRNCLSKRNKILSKKLYFYHKMEIERKRLIKKGILKGHEKIPRYPNRQAQEYDSNEYNSMNKLNDGSLQILAKKRKTKRNINKNKEIQYDQDTIVLNNMPTYEEEASIKEKKYQKKTYF